MEEKPSLTVDAATPNGPSEATEEETYSYYYVTNYSFSFGRYAGTILKRVAKTGEHTIHELIVRDAEGSGHDVVIETYPHVDNWLVLRRVLYDDGVDYLMQDVIYDHTGNMDGVRCMHIPRYGHDFTTGVKRQYDGGYELVSSYIDVVRRPLLPGEDPLIAVQEGSGEPFPPFDVPGLTALAKAVVGMDISKSAPLTVVSQ